MYRRRLFGGVEDAAPAGRQQRQRRRCGRCTEVELHFSRGLQSLLHIWEWLVRVLWRFPGK